MAKSSELPTAQYAKPGFEDVDILRDASGIIAVISRRRSNGVLTFGIFKEFERDGKTERTGFIVEDILGDAYEAMVRLARARCKELRAQEGKSK